MPPFASAELSRDSPLDELAKRRLSSASIASSVRPDSLAILDAFPLPVSSAFDSGDVSSTQAARRSSPGPAPPDISTLEIPRAGDNEHSSAQLQEHVPSECDTVPWGAGDNKHQPTVGFSNHRTNSDNIRSPLAPRAAPEAAPTGDTEQSEYNAPDERALGASLMPTETTPSGHARMKSTETIRPAPDKSPISRTQKRYQRYGHSYSGSQGHISPSISAVKKLPPPPLGPSWLSTEPSPHSAPNSAVSPLPAASIPFSDSGRGAGLQGPVSPQRAAASRSHMGHTRIPSQPGFRYAHPLAPFPGSPTSAAPGPAAVPLVHMNIHSPSRSWDNSSATRVRVPTLGSAADHLYEGCAALALDPRLTFEQWAAAATQFGSAAANLLLEIGWTERWIPWTLISGLNLPPNLSEVDVAELKYGCSPCAGRMAEALHDYGVRLQARQQDAAALRAYNLAEALGSVEAVYSAARLCMKGGRQVKKDVAKARILLRRVNDI